VRLLKDLVVSIACEKVDLADERKEARVIPIGAIALLSAKDNWRCCAAQLIRDKRL
jgi:hypothetical protein